jgi:hypothetical protein
LDLRERERGSNRRLETNIARMEEMKKVYKILIGIPKGKTPIRNLGVHGKIILKWVLKKQSVRMRTRFICSR